MRIKLSPFLLFAFCTHTFAAERFDRCVVSGKVASNIKVSFRNDIEWISKVQDFKLRIESVDGTQTNSKKWCMSKFNARKDSMGNIKVTIDNRRESSPVVKKGMHLTLFWADTGSTTPMESFFVKATK